MDTRVCQSYMYGIYEKSPVWQNNNLRILQDSVASIFSLHIGGMEDIQDFYIILRPHEIIGFMHWIWHSDLESTYLKYAFHFTIMLSWDPKSATLAGLAVSRSRMTSNSKSIVFVYTTSILNLKQPIKDWSRTTSAWVIFLQTFNNEQRSQLCGDDKHKVV